MCYRQRTEGVPPTNRARDLGHPMPLAFSYRGQSHHAGSGPAAAGYGARGVCPGRLGPGEVQGGSQRQGLDRRRQCLEDLGGGGVGLIVR